MKKRLLIALVVGGVIGGATFALAASLGGITSDNLGADTELVASCDTDGVTTTYGSSYSATAGEYVVNSVTVGGIAAGCAGQNIEVTLEGTGGSSLATSTAATASSPTTTVSFASPPSAENVVGVSVLITG